MGKVRAILYIQDALNLKFHERKIYNSPVFSSQPLVLLGEKKAGKSFALFTDFAEWGRVCSRNTGARSERSAALRKDAMTIKPKITNRQVSEFLPNA